VADLVEFLTARLDEDEAVARVASRTVSGSWHLERSSVLWWPTTDDDLDEDDGAGGAWPIDPGTAIAPHIARWDPARVLAEVAVKRQFVRLFSDRPTAPPAGDVFQSAIASIVTSTNDWVLRQLVQPYADHPDFDPTWRDAT